MDITKWRPVIAISLFVIFALLEFYAPYRKRVLSRKDRWPGNLSLILLGSIIVSLMGPVSVSKASLFFEKIEVGVFNGFVSLPWYLELILSLIILDFAIYLQHVIFHKISWAWKLHHVHHADPDLDVTSGLRFHPLEIFFSILYKIFWVVIFGFKVEAILVFEVLLNGLALFNHSNLYLPKRFESFLRLFIVTPQMHVIHHAIEGSDVNHNYGFCLSIWDRLFNTYRKSFSVSEVIGRRGYTKAESNNWKSLLLQPFKH